MNGMVVRPIWQNKQATRQQTGQAHRLDVVKWDPEKKTERHTVLDLTSGHGKAVASPQGGRG